MTKKILSISLAILILLSLKSFVLAEVTGKLNVFTDLKGAQIFIDGKLAGEESVVGWELGVGTHFLKVEYNGKTSYAKTVEITEGRTTTITSDNFVDIRTKTPSRGAVDTEAERLREYRGNAGFGIFGPTPTTGLSVKWWFAKNMGLQALGYAKTESTYMDSSFGGRLLVGFPQKIFAEEVLDAYMALGYGRSFHTDNAFPSLNTMDESASIFFGVEAKLGDLANALFANQRIYVDSKDSAVILIGEIATLGLLNICYTSFEIGLETKNKYTNTSRDTEANLKFNLGLHYFF